jgi:hypothetical protein
MAIKTLAVCGCSWSAVSRHKDYKNTHWSELLANELQLKLYNLAIPGSSNLIIRLQIDKAIELNTDLIIITPTSPDRIEIPNKFVDEPDRISYDDVNDYTTDGNNKYLRSLPLWDFVNKKIPGIEDYVKHLYSSTVKKQIDRWIIRDGIHQIKLKNIPYIIQPQLLWDKNIDIDSDLYQISNQKNIIDNQTCLFYNRVHEDNNFDPGYHTRLKTQKLFSDRLQILIKELNI